MYTITLADGRRLTGLSKNGDNFVSAEKIDETILKGNLSVMTVSDGERDTIYHNAELVQQQEWADGTWYLAFREQTPQEREMAALNKAAGIAFVVLAEQEAIDPVTAAEHISLFSKWVSGVGYTVGNIRQYGEKLYRCLQAHVSQADWTPDTVPALWKEIADPSAEWPIWSQPICAQDAYQMGDKVLHDGKQWLSLVDSNVWAPGAAGTEELWREAQD